MRRTSHLLRSGSIAFLLAACVSQRAIAPNGPAEVFRAFVAALNHADIDAVTLLLDPNATAFLPLDSDPAELVGADVIRAAFVPFFRHLREQGSGPEYMHLVPKNVFTQTIGDFAIVTFDAGAGPVVSRRSLVIQRRVSGWHILHFHGSNIRKSTPKPAAN